MKAFPCEWVEWKDKIATPKASTGMDMRDWFAAHAMKYMGLPTKVYGGRIGDNSWSLEQMDDFPYEQMAAVAYRWADAMMKARG